MFCRSHLRALLLFAVLAAGIALPVTGQPSGPPPSQNKTTVHLRWEARPGVSRYRLQLAVDRQFTDIVFDRVVTGTDIVIDDLLPGRYYWRIAALTTKLDEFSSPAAIDVSAQVVMTRPTPTPRTDAPILPANKIVTAGGWRAAVGNIREPILAHLRAADRFDIVGINNDGVTYALDASTGVALWTVRRAGQTSGGSSIPAPLAFRSLSSSLDNVVIFSGTQAIAIQGASGRELWRAPIPAPAIGATLINDRGGSQIVILDNTRQRLTVLNAADGRTVSQTRLPARVVGAPTAIVGQSTFAVAYENGAVEIRDKNGSVTRSGSTGSSATTGPLFIRGPRGDLVLAGTRDGLTALTADDLRPLGRVSLRDDVPRGVLRAEDLDGDGILEILMITVRRHLIAVNASDGRILWDIAADAETDALAFADVNGDGVLDVFTAAGPGFAVALSGRDGKVIWKDAAFGDLSANHAAGAGARTLIALPGASGLMLIGSDPSLTELRAVVFPKATDRRDRR